MREVPGKLKEMVLIGRLRNPAKHDHGPGEGPTEADMESAIEQGRWITEHPTELAEELERGKGMLWPRGR